MTPADTAHLPGLVERFASLRLLVVGDVILDRYVAGAIRRLSREAPVPIVDVTTSEDVPGGAGNAAMNAAHLGAATSLLAIVGDDEYARTLRDLLEAGGVGTAELVVDAARRTLTKLRVLGDDHLFVRVDAGSTEPAHGPPESALVERLEASYAEGDAVLVSDYGYGGVTPRVVSTLERLQAQHPAVLVVDARDVGRYRAARPLAVKPNFEQAVALLGATGADPPATEADRADWVMTRGERLLDATGAQVAAVTLDTDGAVVIERDRPAYRTYARPASNVHASGAGDTFAATLALALAAGAHAPAAADLASAAASAVVGKDRTATCSAAELQERFLTADKLEVDAGRLAARVELLRGQGKRIVFTNGCFDILHRGHVTYLNRAKTLGDVLIVGVNTDEGVRRLKGPDRPLNPIDDRVEVLTALSCVDHVVPFAEDTPERIIERIRPDVFVKGGDYTREMLPEAPLVEALGGRVEILPYLDDRSTSGLIDRIRRDAAPA